MSIFVLILNTDTRAVLINCAIPNIPPVYKLLGTINKLIPNANINKPNKHLQTLNHPHSNVLSYFPLIFYFLKFYCTNCFFTITLFLRNNII